MRTFDRIQRAIANHSDTVFLRGEFSHFGSPTQVGRALRRLMLDGALVCLGIGVYAKAKPSALTGKPIPTRPLEVLAPEVLNKLGINVMPSRLTQAYNMGNSSQLPAGIVLNVGTHRSQTELWRQDGFVRTDVNMHHDCRLAATPTGIQFPPPGQA